MGDNTIVSQLSKSFYKLRPSQACYATFWAVEKVLDKLISWHPISSLTLKQLTLKTIALIALSSSDRGQTLHALDIGDTAIKNQSISFLVRRRLKTTKRALITKVMECLATDNPVLNVCDYTLAYMNQPLTFRAAAVAASSEKPTQLFISWVPNRPVNPGAQGHLIHISRTKGLTLGMIRTLARNS